MSGSNRSDRPALVVLGLLVASLVLVSLIGLYARHEANYQVGCYTSSEIDQNGIEQHSTICPDDFLYFGDGLAQWIMSIFAVVATGASLVGIVLLRRTFEETKRTADLAFEANKISEDALVSQFRPWIEIVEGSVRIPSVEFGADVLSVGVEVTVENIGNSPAIDVALKVNVYVNENPSFGYMRKIADDFLANPIKGETSFPKRTSTLRMDTSVGLDAALAETNAERDRIYKTSLELGGTEGQAAMWAGSVGGIMEITIIGSVGYTAYASKRRFQTTFGRQIKLAYPGGDSDQFMQFRTDAGRSYSERELRIRTDRWASIAE